MALLHEAVDFKKLDTRLIERNLTRGVLTRQDYDKAVQNLPDDGENAQWVDIETLIDEGEKGSANTKP